MIIYHFIGSVFILYNNIMCLLISLYYRQHFVYNQREETLFKIEPIWPISRHTRYSQLILLNRYPH